MQYFRYVAITLIVLLISSCTTIDTNKDKIKPEDFVSLINPGDTVSIRTKDGSKYSFIVSGITKESIIGGGNTVSTDNVDEITVTYPSGARKTLTAIGRANRILFFGSLIKLITN